MRLCEISFCHKERWRRVYGKFQYKPGSWHLLTICDESARIYGDLSLPIHKNCFRDCWL